jgi:hypothetical protein
MRSDERHRLESLEAHINSRPDTGTAFIEMLQLEKYARLWDYYDPEEIMWAANEQVERFEADIELMRTEYRLAINDDRRHELLTRSRLFQKLVDMLAGVRGEAARDLGRPVTPYTDRRPLLAASNMSPADLIALTLARHKEPT